MEQNGNGYPNGYHEEEAQAQQADQAGKRVGESMTNALFELLQSLPQAVSNNGNVNGVNRTTEIPIEIKSDHTTLYQSGSDDGPPTNNTTLADVEYLQHALKQAPGSRINGPTQSILITVSGQPVFQAEGGIVTHNSVPRPVFEQSASHQPGPQQFGQGGSYGALPHVIVQSPVTLERSQDKTPSLLERIDQASEIDKPSIYQEKWMKMSLGERFKGAIEQSFSFKRKDQAADVAIELLQRYGSRQGNEFVYQAHSYRIRGVGRHVLVEDRQGKGLVTIKTKIFGRPAVRGYKLTPHQESDFLRVYSELTDNNFSGISQDPLLRAMQLRGLAPDGDEKIVDDIKALSVSDIARDLLSASGSQPDQKGNRVLDGKQYIIVHSPESLSIYAKGGRGLIFAQQDGKIESKLTAADTKHFIFVSKELAALQKQRSIQQPVQRQATMRMG